MSAAGAERAPLTALLPASGPDEIFDRFAAWSAEGGRPLYPAQEEALLGIVSGAHVVLSTPTGSGKSLVALGAHLAALAESRRSIYTAPIKALVSEKFFQLVDAFGPENVGMITGDTSVNPGAPILCATAEILANRALREADGTGIDLVVMDEFHFYSDPDRGWAWQVPLLTMTGAQFLLMSATLGDVTAIVDDLSRRTGRPTERVTGVDRPVPLVFRWSTVPVQETVEELVATGDAPVYVVHFSQAAAVERAQSLTSLALADRDRRDRIAEAIGDFRFRTGFGATLSRLLRAGVGVHSAGMLPKYRRLVEQLAQRGLLRAICGTDTLGVGINIPLRTVLLTTLVKYDGVRMRRLNAREFHQIAGRAGRAGFDDRGTVVVEAPDHEIENARLVRKAGDDPVKLKRVQRKKPPAGQVTWTQATFDRVVAAEPEPLVPRMRITSAMLVNVIARADASAASAFDEVRSLVFDNHEPRTRQLALARRALALYRTLRTAGIVTQVPDPGGGAPVIRLTVDLSPDFALNQPLSPFALAAFELLDPESPEFALDVVSVVEATLDDPRPVLREQEHRARGEAVGAMKAEGIEYEERMELLEEVTHPKPLEELLTATFETYVASQPWAADFELRPKSVVRALWERAMTFTEFVSDLGLARSEGVLLRYLSDAWRALRQVVPPHLRTEELSTIIDWLGQVVRQVDSSLLDEWDELVHPDAVRHDARETEIAPPAASAVTHDRRAFLALVRNELFRRVQLAALRRTAPLGALDAASGMDQVAWETALDEYFDEHDAIGTGPEARSARMLVIDEHPLDVDGEPVPRAWAVQQILDDPAGDGDWRLTATVDLEASDDEGVAVVHVTALARLDG